MCICGRRNVFDEDYVVRGFYFANEPPLLENKRYVQLGEPRQIGGDGEVGVLRLGSGRGARATDARYQAQVLSSGSCP